MAAKIRKGRGSDGLHRHGWDNNYDLYDTNPGGGTCCCPPACWTRSLACCGSRPLQKLPDGHQLAGCPTGSCRCPGQSMACLPGCCQPDEEWDDRERMYGHGGGIGYNPYPNVPMHDVLECQLQCGSTDMDGTPTGPILTGDCMDNCVELALL